MRKCGLRRDCLDMILSINWLSARNTNLLLVVPRIQSGEMDRSDPVVVDGCLYGQKFDEIKAACLEVIIKTCWFVAASKHRQTSLASL